MTASTAFGQGSSRIAASAKIAMQKNIEPGDWHALYDRIGRRSGWMETALFHVSVLLVTLSGLFAAAGALAYVITSVSPDISSVYLACFIIPPGFLFGSAMGQTAGNRFLALWFGLDNAGRRGFATRLTLARAPSTWSKATRRWLFTGDWLTVPEYDYRLPYVRIFISGPAPLTCAKEDALWRDILGKISGDGEWEAGANHREISCPDQLPGWARKVDGAGGAEQLESRIGEDAARDWISHLWRRAARQWPPLGSGEFPLHAKKEVFETHYFLLSGEREALVVVLRPSGAASEIETERETAEPKGIAA